MNIGGGGKVVLGVASWTGLTSLSSSFFIIIILSTNIIVLIKF